MLNESSPYRRYRKPLNRGVFYYALLYPLNIIKSYAYLNVNVKPKIQPNTQRQGELQREGGRQKKTHTHSNIIF